MSERIRYSRVNHPTFRRYYDVYIGTRIIGYVASDYPRTWYGFALDRNAGGFAGTQRGIVAAEVLRRWQAAHP